MENDQCLATGRLIDAKDHASVQVSVCGVDENGKMIPGGATNIPICGAVRHMGESDDALNRITQEQGSTSPRLAATERAQQQGTPRGRLPGAPIRPRHGVHRTGSVSIPVSTASAPHSAACTAKVSPESSVDGSDAGHRRTTLPRRPIPERTMTDNASEFLMHSIHGGWRDDASVWRPPSGVDAAVGVPSRPPQDPSLARAPIVHRARTIDAFVADALPVSSASDWPHVDWGAVGGLRGAPAPHSPPVWEPPRRAATAARTSASELSRAFGGVGVPLASSPALGGAPIPLSSSPVEDASVLHQRQSAEGSMAFGLGDLPRERRGPPRSASPVTLGARGAQRERMPSAAAAHAHAPPPAAVDRGLAERLRAMTLPPARADAAAAPRLDATGLQRMNSASSLHFGSLTSPMLLHDSPPRVASPGTFSPPPGRAEGYFSSGKEARHTLHLMEKPLGAATYQAFAAGARPTESPGTDVPGAAARAGALAGAAPHASTYFLRDPEGALPRAPMHFPVPAAAEVSASMFPPPATEVSASMFPPAPTAPPLAPYAYDLSGDMAPSAWFGTPGTLRLGDVTHAADGPGDARAAAHYGAGDAPPSAAPRSQWSRVDAGAPGDAPPHRNPSFGSGHTAARRHQPARGRSTQTTGAGAPEGAPGLRMPYGGRAPVPRAEEGAARAYGPAEGADDLQRVDMRELRGRLVEVSTDQHGSRLIQERLGRCTQEERDLVFSELFAEARRLMTDVFGNYVIQKLFEYGSAEQVQALGEQLEGHVLALSLGTYGCRVVQKAFEHVGVAEKVRLSQELVPYVLDCVRDQNANHVVQKVLEQVPSTHLDFVAHAFSGHVPALASHCYSCRVLQRIFAYCSEAQRRPLLHEMHQDTLRLMQDQYGNYVIQWVLQRGEPRDRAEIVRKAKTHLLQLARHKFASNVVELVVEVATPADLEDLLQELLGPVSAEVPGAVSFADTQPCVATVMMQDQYANYVLQRFLQVVQGAWHDRLVAAIRPTLQALRQPPLLNGLPGGALPAHGSGMRFGGGGHVGSKPLLAIERLIEERGTAPPPQPSLRPGFSTHRAPAHYPLSATSS
ncbi:mRNA binding protein puf3 [Malassezia sp. CBS 17886]|nr:mRNA binding protein puf3 [Malassezia sp. CBS 17886]